MKEKAGEGRGNICETKGEGCLRRSETLYSNTKKSRG